MEVSLALESQTNIPGVLPDQIPMVELAEQLVPVQNREPASQPKRERPRLTARKNINNTLP
jgi:hypothetical protein